MHNPEIGHKCRGCGNTLPCTIEDGACEYSGTCDDCIKAAVYERMDRWDDDDQDYS